MLLFQTKVDTTVSSFALFCRKNQANASVNVPQPCLPLHFQLPYRQSSLRHVFEDTSHFLQKSGQLSDSEIAD